MSLSTGYCAALAHKLSAYDRGPNNGSLRVLLAILTGLAALHVVASALLWCTEAQTAWRFRLSAFVLGFAAGTAVAYFVFAARREARALGEFARTSQQYDIRNPAAAPPWQDLLVIFLAALSAVVAARAACDRGGGPGRTSESTMRSVPPPRKTMAALRLADDDEPHPARTRCCSVCLEEMSTGALRVLPCTHAFHEQCVARWFATARRGHCPVCMASVMGAVAAAEHSTRYDSLGSSSRDT